MSLNQLKYLNITLRILLDHSIPYYDKEFSFSVINSPSIHCTIVTPELTVTFTKISLTRLFGLFQ